MASFLEPIIGKLAELLAEEVVALKGVDGEVECLKDELEIIQPLLRDAEAKPETNEAVKAWVRQIRHQADRIENVIDLYRYRLRKIRSESGLMASLHRASHFVQTLKPRHRISSEIQSINKSLREIKDRATDYGLRPWDQPGPSTVVLTECADPRLESLVLEGVDLVGIEPARSELVACLVNGPSERMVISIVGEGGVGKSTLCKSVFDDEALKRCFESSHVWITVSQPYDLKKILKKMREEICKGSESSLRDVADDTIADLIRCLRNDLKTKRYLFVFDDVWEENFWEEMNLALPDMNNGSRIIITTRNGSIANSCKQSPHDFIHSLEPWSKTLAIELFYKKAFGHLSCPEELKEISMEIISKCQGLPLVLAAIASLLATKEKVAFEWQRVLNDLNSKVEVSSRVTRVQKILSLGYYDLPQYLRSCFLCFGMFPEDFWISDERLCRLWIAEGFIQSKGERALEEVAKDYMSQLVKRNLVVFDQSNMIGEGDFFRVHDLMRDVILIRAEELCFFRLWDAKNSRFRGKGRRLVISGSARNAFENVESSEVRSLFLHNIADNDALLTKSCMVTLFKKFKLLEVLEVENALFDNVPKELGNLLCLKYLSLSNINIKSLPKSISKLQNLYSLDIRHTLIRELPNEINKLRKLQHILAYSYNHNYTTTFDFIFGVSIQVCFGNLEELQTLTTVEAHVGGVALMKEMEKLTKLRWLDISKLTRQNSKALCAIIGRMKHLERLFIAAIDENEILDLQHLPSPPLSLRDLLLIGQLERLPEWIPKLQNLCGLTLNETKLIDDPIKSLKGLPNLDTLQISSKAYEGEELHFEEGGFLKLRRLWLTGLYKLKVVKFDGRALPNLERLDINNCRQLKEVPSVQHLKRIKYAVANGRRLN